MVLTTSSSMSEKPRVANWRQIFIRLKIGGFAGPAYGASEELAR